MLAVTASPAQALVRDWSFTNGGVNNGSGTFTTSGISVTPGATYSVTDVSGTFSVNGDGPFAITQLLSTDPWGNPADNTFLWSGPGAPLQVTGNGITFASNSVSGIQFSSFTIYYDPIQTLAYLPVNYLQGQSNAYSIGGSIVATTLSPGASPQVPAPLPMVGALSVWGWSRRLRRRIPSAV